MATVQLATVDPGGAPDPSTGQGRCVNCGMHVILNDAGDWHHTMSGIRPCEPAWRPRRRAVLALLNGGV